MRSHNRAARIVLGLFLVVTAGIPSFSDARARTNEFFDAPFGADRQEIAEALKDCKNAIREDAIAIFAWDRYRRADAAYRQAIKAASVVLDKESEEEKGALAKANSAFEKFRRETCYFDIRGGGSMSAGLLFQCLEGYTRRRTKALRAYVNCEKTGSCEAPNMLYLHENADVFYSGRQ